MPWKKEHKSETRGRILETASAAIRERGVAGIGVAQVMEAAGLTHGGFYAHFDSKDELVADAFDYACRQSSGALGALFVARALGEAEGEKYLAQVRRFLRDSPDEG